MKTSSRGTNASLRRASYALSLCVHLSCIAIGFLVGPKSHIEHRRFQCDGLLPWSLLCCCESSSTIQLSSLRGPMELLGRFCWLKNLPKASPTSCPWSVRYSYFHIRN
jgi:hypothetical protein